MKNYVIYVMLRMEEEEGEIRIISILWGARAHMCGVIPPMGVIIIIMVVIFEDERASARCHNNYIMMDMELT